MGIWLERVYGLNRGKVRGHERPHKPVLLLAVLELMDRGLLTENGVMFSGELEEGFRAYFEVVCERDDRPTIENPFYYLQSDGFWQVETTTGPLHGQVGVGRLRTLGATGRLDADLWLLLQSELHREQLREGIVCRFFPGHREALRSLLKQRLGASGRGTAMAVADLQAAFEPARSSAFRRTVLEIYDFQCAACGLRIRLPEDPVTLVDAAHLIPFSESRNDHPSNGIALCKNHHWAMDRNLIAPGSDRRWLVSSRLLAHRSSGEQALLELRGREVLPPHDGNFPPAAASLSWREARFGA